MVGTATTGGAAGTTEKPKDEEAQKAGVAEAAEHETPTPTQAELDATKLAMGKSGAYLTRDAKPR